VSRAWHRGRIGGQATLEFAVGDAEHRRETAAVVDHDDATRRVLGWLESIRLLGALDGVGHRVVHGGDRFAEPTLIDARLWRPSRR